jgi:hypothetical protein
LLSYEAIRRVRLLRPLFGLELGTPRAAKIKATSVPVAQRLAPQLGVSRDQLGVPQDIN